MNPISSWLRPPSISFALVALALGVGCSSGGNANSSGENTQNTNTGSSGAGGAGGGSASICACFDGDGTYCVPNALAQATAAGCSLGMTPSGDNDLLTCIAGVWSASETCAVSCESGEIPAADECGLPECPCFVKVSWCGASAARHGLTLDPPCRVPLVPDHDQDILACDGPTWIVKEACAEGCFEAPTGTPDACVTDRTPQDPGWEPCPSAPLLKYGLHPEASDRLRCSGVTASRISQTIGDAAASAGFHAQDGTTNGDPYCAAVDLRVLDLSTAQIKDLLVKLGNNGFAAWYRQPGYDGWPSSQAPHIHAVFAGVVMKSVLRAQVRDYLIGKNGLSSHTTYKFWQPDPMTHDIVSLLFQRNYTP